MHPSSRPSVPPRSRKFENRHTEVKPSQVTKKGDEKSFKAASSHHNIRGPAESSRLKGQGARAPIMHSKSVPPQKLDSYATRAVPKPKTRNTALNLIPAAVDPNCNEPSLPCLCCDGHSPQDSNSLFNHNHNNNNTVNIRQQMKLPPPLPLQEPAALKVDDKEEQLLPNPKEEKYEKNGNIDEKEGAGPKIDGCHMKGMVDVNGNDDQNDDFGADDDHVDIDEEDDEDDDDTLVASCCNCPESMLDFSLTSSTSSSSTSISSCSDLECDCPDLFSLSSQEQVSPECYEFSRSSVSLSAFQSSMLPLDLKPFAGFPTSPCSSDEGYPSLPLSPLSDDKESPDERGVKVDLLHFLDSMEELGKVDLFYRIVQLAQWETDDDLLVRDRLDHQQKLQRVNKEVQLSYLVKLQQEQLDFNPEDINGLLEAMDSMKFLYKNNKISDSQDFSDAGVDLTGASDLDQASTPDSLTNSPLDSPLSPPKPPERHASSQPGSYICVKEFPVSNTGSTCFSSNTSVPSLPGLSSSSSFLPPLSQPASYFSINTKQPAVTSPSPPIPPPRRRHKARLEALRLAELERIPQCLPPPASRPPPLPPPPSISSPPPLLPPPPSFHALDVEIRKLLALAGLTQAELLKLSPELGVCVDAVLENEQHATSDVSQVHIYGKQMSEFKGLDSTLREEIFLKDRSTALNHFKGYSEGFSCEQNEANRTTSFTEMARQRKRNGENCSLRCMYGTTNVSLSPISYNTDLSNTNVSNVSFGNFDFNLMISDKPPPPPPRPLPPNPPIVSNHQEFPFLKSCSVPANASRPDRFDWLIAFTPDAEPPFLEIQKSPTSGVQEASNLGTKVTTFKELRKRSKQSSPPTRIQPDPDPTVITPDPDFLYNLKWRREKTNGDGWEYTSQAQASFLQPPSTPASLSLFREMCHLNTQEDCPAKPQMSQNVGTSVREGSLRTICGGRDKDWHGNQVKNDDREIRGKADGAWTLGSRTSGPIRSLSCAVAEQRDVTWMEHDVKPMKECLLEKKTLVNSLSASVEAILAEFNSSRTVVQKTLSGDSSINPPLARLVLQCLCPAVHSLLCDGLKPYQSDVIAGRRPNSPWGLIQASTKPGPSTHALHNLQTKVAGLTQLKQSRHKFNAFLFGLLNVKLLDYWLFHLLSCNDVLEAYYRPTSFMRLSLASCQPLFEELLLLLQPLSLLTFNLDLLFQHHHLEPSSLTMTSASKNSENFSPQNEHLSPKGHFYESMPQIGCMLNQDLDGLDLQGSTPNTILGKNTFDLFKESAYRNSISLTSSSSKEEAPLCWLIGNERFEDHGGRNTARLSQQAGQALQQGWGAVVRLGELLGQNLGFANSSSAENVKVSNSTDDFENHRGPAQHCQQEGSSLRDTGGAVSWSMGRLFGASRSSSNTPTRRPSQWLSPSVSVLTRIANLGQSVQQEKSKLEGTINSERDGDINETIEQPKPQRVVRTLCDHLGTGAELSFRKGEKLILLGGVDQDWIRCRQGHKEGLVSIDYASLIM